MKELSYQVRFATPAFLGNAEQQAQWRTPPIKALIRQWWRVAQARAHGYDHAKLRQSEMKLFGAASDDGSEKSHRSLLRLRLSAWEMGQMSGFADKGPTVSHPEVKFRVGSDLYLGFGPVEYDKGSKAAKFGTSKSSGERRTAIDDKAKATLRLMLPDAHTPEIETALQLAAWFGTLGSRSRNGWGAPHLAHAHLQALDRKNLQALGVLRPLPDCLREEWPHAVGTDGDGTPLVWKTAPVGSWREAMKALARLKILFRTSPPMLSLTGKADGDLAGRQILAYPITHHAVIGPINKAAGIAGWVDLDMKTGKPKTDSKGWLVQGERLANQIRFKVHPCAGGKFEGVIVHLPCKVPDELVNKLAPKDQVFIRSNELKVWQEVHLVLDKNATRLA